MIMPGKQIRRLRTERHLTQEQLAEAMNVSVPAVSKWETEQSAPDLSLLVALADYFSVSVDSLLGHTVQRDRLDDFITQMAEARKSRDLDRLCLLVSETLNAYPNSYEAIEAAAEACYALYIQGGYEERLKQSIELTKRLFSLIENHSDARIADLYLSLANQYELLHDWEQALRYYELYNVNGASNMHIARCKLRLGCAEEALHVLSDDLAQKASSLMSFACTLSDIHEACEHPDQASAVLAWAVRAMEELGPENPYLAYMLCTMELKLFALADTAGQNDAAVAALQSAVRFAHIADDTQADPRAFAFLSPTKSPELMTSQPDCMQMIRMIADYAQNPAYRQVLDDQK